MAAADDALGPCGIVNPGSSDNSRIVATYPFPPYPSPLIVELGLSSTTKTFRIRVTFPAGFVPTNQKTYFQYNFFEEPTTAAAWANGNAPKCDPVKDGLQYFVKWNNGSALSTLPQGSTANFNSFSNYMEIFHPVQSPSTPFWWGQKYSDICRHLDKGNSTFAFRIYNADTVLSTGTSPNCNDLVPTTVGVLPFSLTCNCACFPAAATVRKVNPVPQTGYTRIRVDEVAVGDRIACVLPTYFGGGQTDCMVFFRAHSSPESSSFAYIQLTYKAFDSTGRIATPVTFTASPTHTLYLSNVTISPTARSATAPSASYASSMGAVKTGMLMLIQDPAVAGFYTSPVIGVTVVNAGGAYAFPLEKAGLPIVDNVVVFRDAVPNLIPGIAEGQELNQVLFYLQVPLLQSVQENLASGCSGNGTCPCLDTTIDPTCEVQVGKTMLQLPGVEDGTAPLNSVVTPLLQKGYKFHTNEYVTFMHDNLAAGQTRWNISGVLQTFANYFY